MTALGSGADLKNQYADLTQGCHTTNWGEGAAESAGAGSPH